MDINNLLFEFIENSPSSHHAVKSACDIFDSYGFTPLKNDEIWNIEKGGKYYIVCGSSSVIAFKIPNKNISNYRIIASHGDTPCFKIKHNPEIKFENNLYTSLNVEEYGGNLLAPWFDRPLSIAGRVIVMQNGKLCSRLVNIKRNLVSVVNMAIHLSRDANKGMEYKIQKDMLPIFAGAGSNATLNDIVAKELNINSDDILDADLYLYNNAKGTVWGAQDEFISAPRLDDLQCCFASVTALVNNTNENSICMSAIFDNEEVGSSSMQGAASTFLKRTVRRIASSLNISEDQLIIALSKSSMISADNGHAIHPNYPEKHDKTNRPYVGGGVLIKYSANQKYTTSAFTGAAMAQLCKNANVPYQVFHNHSDIAGGSTLGNISISQLSIPCADIGIAMLAMHSPYETAGANDTAHLIATMSEYFKTDVLYYE